MPLSDPYPRPETDMNKIEDRKDKPADFIIDSAGNVAPSTKQKAEALAGRTAPQKGRWSEPG